MSGGPSKGASPKPKTTPVRPPRLDGYLGIPLSPTQRPEEQSVEQAVSLTPITSIPRERLTLRPSDKGKGRAVDEIEANVSDKPLRKADGMTTKKRSSSGKKKFRSLFHKRLPRRTPMPQHTVGSRIMEGGFYVQRARKTLVLTERPFRLTEHFGSAASPISISGRTRDATAGISPSMSNYGVILNQVNQASHLRGIIRDRIPSPIRVIGNQWTPPRVQRLLPWDDDNDQDELVSPGPSGWRPPNLREQYGEQSPLSRDFSDTRGQPPLRQLKALSVTHNTSDAAKEELKTDKSKGFKNLFKSSKVPEKSSPSSPKELNSNSPQYQAIVSPALTNIDSNREQHAERLSPVSPTIKSPPFSGNSFKNLFKRSPRTSENLSSPSNRLQYRQSREAAKMDNNQENHEAGVSAIMDDKIDEVVERKDDDQESSNSSSTSTDSFLTCIEPLHEAQMVHLPQRTPWMQYDSNLPRPIPGNSQPTQNAMNYTDREYGTYHLGYTGLQPGVPSGLDFLLNIGNYGRKLRIFALNASNERFKKFKYYKTFEIEHWAQQQGELFKHHSDDLPSKAFHDESFKKIVGFEEPLCRKTRSLPDLRSAWELSKPFDAAFSYSLPPPSYPLKKYVYPKKVLSFEPRESYAGLDKESYFVDTFLRGFAGAGSCTSHIEAFDPFET